MSRAGLLLSSAGKLLLSSAGKAEVGLTAGSCSCCSSGPQCNCSGSNVSGFMLTISGVTVCPAVTTASSGQINAARINTSLFVPNGSAGACGGSVLQIFGNSFIQFQVNVGGFLPVVIANFGTGAPYSLTGYLFYANNSSGTLCMNGSTGSETTPNFYTSSACTGASGGYGGSATVTA